MLFCQVRDGIYLFCLSVFYIFFYSSFGIAPKEAKGLENFNRSAEFFGQPRGVGVGDGGLLASLLLGCGAEWDGCSCGRFGSCAYNLLFFGLIAFEDDSHPNLTDKAAEKIATSAATPHTLCQHGLRQEALSPHTLAREGPAKYPEGLFGLAFLLLLGQCQKKKKKNT